MKEKMKILVAYDGSDGSDAALEDLQRAGLPTTAEVLLMTLADVLCRRQSMTKLTTPFRYMCLTG